MTRKKDISLTYETLKSIICPDESWIYQMENDEGREEVNAILDSCVEMCKLEKRSQKQFHRATVLREVLVQCEHIFQKYQNLPKRRVKILQCLWDDITNEVVTLGLVPEYDHETNRMIFAPLSHIDLKCPE